MRCQCGAPLEPDARFCGSCGNAARGTEQSPDSSSSGMNVDALLGREIGGRYRIVAKLGEGGMGAVFRAEQISLKRPVALKVLRPELSADHSLVRRFNAEAELAAKLNHPNTVTLYDFGQDSDGALYIAMELVQGDSLRTAMQRGGPVAPVRALHICRQVCASLHDAHAHGIIHRDLKPDNVMLSVRGAEQDIVRVLDFGIAKLRHERPDGTAMPMTQAGALLGTPHYMAPEQIQGQPVDPRTDVYALGAMLYEGLTGRFLFDAPSIMAVLSKQITEVPVHPCERRPELQLPRQVGDLAMHCLQKHPDHRPPTMEALSGYISSLLIQLGASPALTPPQLRYGGQPPVPAPPGPRGAPAPSAPLTAQQSYLPPTHAGAAGGGKAWLWLLLGLLAAAGTGAGVYFALGGGSATTTTASANEHSDEARDPARPEMTATTGHDTEAPAIEIGSDFSTPRSRRGFQFDDDDDDDTTEPTTALTAPTTAGFGSATPTGATGGTRYTHPELGFTIAMPAGFTYEVDSSTGLMTGAGTADGQMTMVFALGIAMDTRILGEEGQEAAMEGFVTGSDGTLVRRSDRRIQGKKRRAGIVDMAPGMRVETVMYVEPSMLLIVAVGAPLGQFDGTSALRSRFFEHDVLLP